MQLEIARRLEKLRVALRFLVRRPAMYKQDQVQAATVILVAKTKEIAAVMLKV